MCGWLRAAQPESVYLINCVYKHWTPFVCMCVCMYVLYSVFREIITGIDRLYEVIPFLSALFV